MAVIPSLAAISINFDDIGCILIRVGCAALGIASLVPSVGGNPDVLHDFRGDLELVADAFLATVWQLSIGPCLVIKPEEVVVAPPVSVLVDVRVSHHLHEVREGDVPNAIVGVFSADLFPESRSPSLVFVRPRALVLLNAPRVPDLDELDTGG